MPNKPPHQCNGCGQPVHGRCATCQPAYHTSTHRGSTRASRAARHAMLTDQPLCAWPTCKRLAIEDDHIIPLQWNGEDDDRSNHHGLCKRHHRTKSQAEANVGRRLPNASLTTRLNAVLDHFNGDERQWLTQTYNTTLTNQRNPHT